MAAFRRLFFAALCGGLLGGLFASGLQHATTVPLILKAETYEDTVRQANAANAGAPGEAVAAHEADDRAPEDRIERALYTTAADVLVAIGFALLLAAGIALRGGEAGWRAGLLWGLAGFAAFALAPGLGLPPDVPGSPAAPLAARQLWWVATAIATAGGLALVVLTRRTVAIAAGVVLILLPHFYGAPHAAAAATVPAALAQRFAAVVSLTTFLFWLLLGASTGLFYHLFRPRRG